MSDAEIDAFFPSDVRAASSRFWSPVQVARRAAEHLAELKVRRVLDVGSGAGKFCVVAAARAPRLEFVGFEQRASLVAVAESLAVNLGAPNVSFRCGDVTEVPWAEFDAFYVFNSFAENAFSRAERFDDTVELSHSRRVTDVMRVMRRLDAAPLETVLATYYGFGGPIPRSYELRTTEACGTGWLRIWQKKRVQSAKTFWMEDDGSVCELTLREFAACMREEELEEES